MWTVIIIYILHYSSNGVYCMAPNSGEENFGTLNVICQYFKIFNLVVDEKIYVVMYQQFHGAAEVLSSYEKKQVQW